MIAAAYYQINLLRQPPRVFVGHVYAWVAERIDPEELDDWELGLDDLLPWQDSDSEAAAQVESDSFFAMMGTGG